MGVNIYISQLETNPEEIRSRMEALLGTAVSISLSTSGFLNYTCPFPGCSGSHFGVCYDPSSRFRVGAWSCFKCGASGLGFRSLCISLGRAEQEFEECVIVPIVIKKRTYVDPIKFGRVWTSIALRSSLSDIHKRMLITRGVEAEKTPNWFTVPGKKELGLYCKLFGEEVSEEVSLKTGTRFSLFATPGRLAIVYPQRPWHESNTFLSSYKQGEKQYKIVRPRGISTESILYYRGSPKGDTLVITEGEIKAEASFQAGLPTIGMLGVGNGREGVVQCIKFLLKSGFPKHIALVFDQDVKETSRVPVCLAIDKLRLKLIEEIGDQCPDIYDVILPETIPGDKVDIDSYIGFHTKQEGLNKARERYRDLIAERTQNAD